MKIKAYTFINFPNVHDCMFVTRTVNENIFTYQTLNFLNPSHENVHGG